MGASRTPPEEAGLPLTSFHPLVQAWFRSRFDAPTEAQAQGWPAIARGRHTLIAAPTGSGKTLAAFLTCLDSLVRAGLDGGLPERTQVVYVSPLKALSNDIQRNLSDPLSGIGALAIAEGTPLPEIRVAVRTGDTSPSQRQAMAKRPPHILITTPESLYLLDGTIAGGPVGPFLVPRELTAAEVAALYALGQAALGLP
jgi:ATP-dependent Lhr-like helicase